MTKDERAALLRSRFAKKAGSRAWVSLGKKRPKEEIKKPYSGSRQYLPSDVLPTDAAKWIFLPDPTPRPTVNTEQPGKTESAVTKIAKAMYAENGWEWHTQSQGGDGSGNSGLTLRTCCRPLREVL